MQKKALAEDCDLLSKLNCVSLKRVAFFLSLSVIWNELKEVKTNKIVFHRELSLLTHFSSLPLRVPFIFETVGIEYESCVCRLPCFAKLFYFSYAVVAWRCISAESLSLPSPISVFQPRDLHCHMQRVARKNLNPCTSCRDLFNFLVLLVLLVFLGSQYSNSILPFLWGRER